VRKVDLAQQSLAQLLFELLTERFTGTITMDQPGSGRRIMRLRGGMPLHFDWVLAGTRLAELLGAKRPISELDLDGALGAALAAGQRIGEVLRERGLAGEADVLRTLREQCLLRGADAMRVRSGTALVTPGDDLEPALLQVNVLQLVQRGISEHYDTARARAELGDLSDARVRASASFARHQEQFKFRGEDTSVIAVLLSGKPTDASALARLPATSEQRVAQLLCVLHTCRMLEPAEAAPAVDAGVRSNAEPPAPAAIRAATPAVGAQPVRRMEPSDSGRVEPRRVEPRSTERRADAGPPARARAQRHRGASEPHPLWSGSWPRIWILSAIAIVSLLVMNVLVRSDW
jgi:hypothetical protein